MDQKIYVSSDTQERGRQFLSRLIRSYGQTSKTNPVGRNIARCYAYAIAEDTDLFEDILGMPIDELIQGQGEHQLNLKLEEYNNHRRTDISIEYGLQRIARAEIKVDDQNTKHSYEQLKAYVKSSTKKTIPFFYITKNMPSDDEIRILKPLENLKLLHVIRHYEIANRLKQRKKSQVAQMIANYLEAEHMSGYEPVEYTDKQLRDLLRAFLPSGYWARTPHKAPAKMAEMVHRFLSNLQTIGEWLRDGNTKTFPKPFYVYPSVYARYNVRKLLKKVEQEKKNQNLSMYLRDLTDPGSSHPDLTNFFDSGLLYFVVEAEMDTTPPTFLSISFGFDYNANGKKKVKESICAEFSNKVIEEGYNNWDYYASKKYKDFGEPWAEKIVTGLGGREEKDIRRDIQTVIENAQKKMKKLKHYEFKKAEGDNAEIADKIRKLGKSKAAAHAAELKFPGLV